jgi:hypothetical protein
VNVIALKAALPTASVYVTSPSMNGKPDDFYRRYKTPLSAKATGFPTPFLKINRHRS